MERAVERTRNSKNPKCVKNGEQILHTGSKDGDYRSVGKFPNIPLHCDFTRLFDHKNVYNTPKFRFCALFFGQTDNLFLPKIEEREDFK